MAQLRSQLKVTYPKTVGISYQKMIINEQN
jgi:hypothetical protein